MALSYQNYTGNNSTDTFSIPFTYTATSEISVTVNGVAETGLTFPSSSQVQLTSAPASGTVVQVRRTTNLASRAIDFASGSVLTEEDLDNSNIQIFHASQESVDLTDDTIQEDIDSKWDAESKVIKNVANPTNAQDATTKDYLENTWLTIADKAQLNSLNTTNLNTVAGSIANVNAVAGDATDIGTVSSNIASVNTVATNIADVVTVANDLNEAISEIETAALDLQEATSEIDTVSNAIANVNTVGLAIANVNTVGGAIANVNTTATNINNVNTVAGVSGNVTTVAGIASNVTAVAGDATDIGTVATNIADVNTVAANNADIDTVAGISANVTTVAGIASNVTSVAGNATNINSAVSNATNINTVAGIAANVTSVAGNATNINSAVSNETNINAAVSNATNINSAVSNATNINTVAGGITNVNTVATNLASVNNFADVYRIANAAPSDSLTAGDLYFNTSTNVLNVYGDSGWQNAGSSVNGTSQRYHYDIGGAVTSVTGSDANSNTLAYDAGYVDVYVNGVRMSTADVTVTSGDTVTFAEALASGDEVDIVAYGTFAVASLNADNLDSGTVPDARITGAYTGITNLTATGVGSFGSLVVTGSSTFDDIKLTTVALPAAGNPSIALRDTNNVIYHQAGSANNIVFLDSSQNTMYNMSSTSHIFNISNSEKFRINSSGNAGLGVVPNSSWHSTLTALQIGGNASLSAQSAVGASKQAYFSQNVFNDGDQKYISTDQASNYYQGDGKHVFQVAASGSANAVISWNTAMTVDNSGNVGINTSSPTAGYMLHVGGSSGVHTKVKIEATTATGQAELDLSADPAGVSYLNLGDEDSHNIGYLGYFHSDNSMRFQTNAAERMRIDSSGKLLMGTTSAFSYSGINPLLTINNSAGIGIKGIATSDAGFSTLPSANHNYYAGYFLNSSGTGVGNILCTVNSTAYNTSSDYRLKENVVTDWDATTRLKQLKPSRFNFISEADRTVDGFLAHEVQEIVPEAITGTKDALDADGNPDYQGIDQSKLVPLLVKTIQELEARITALEGA